MRRSRGLRTASAWLSAARRFAVSSLSARMLLVRGIVDQPVLPLAVALLAQRRVERGVARQATVHLDHFLLAHAKLGRDRSGVLGLEVAFLESGDLALGLAQVEEQFLLISAVVPSFTRLHERRIYS